MAWPHPDTEFTDNYSTTRLLQYVNLFLSHNVLTKHLLPALDLRSAFLTPKPENFTHFHNETNCVRMRPKKTTTFPPLLAVSDSPYLKYTSSYQQDVLYFHFNALKWGQSLFGTTMFKERSLWDVLQRKLWKLWRCSPLMARQHQHTAPRWQPLVSLYVLKESCLSSLQGGGRRRWEQESISLPF